MKGGAAKSLGKNEERNRLPWQGNAVPCVNRAGEAVVEKAVEFSIWRFLTIVSTDDVNKDRRLKGRLAEVLMENKLG